MVDRAVVLSEPAPAMKPAEDGANPAGAPVGGERPEWLPEKFGTAEELAKSYAELEAKLGGADGSDTSSAANDKPTGADTEGEGTGTESNEVSYGEAVDKAITDAGLTPDSIFAEYKENSNSLSDATYEALEKAGYPRDTVNQFVKGFATEVETAETETDTNIDQIMSDIGGADEFARMSEWAGSNLSDDDLGLYNRLVDEGTPDTARMAVLTLRGWYEAATGVEPKLEAGGGVPVTADAFTSPQEMSAAMAEARKSKDPAKIKAVEAKALRSSVFG